jgi:uncharacterized glyoxalase superfamily protein PhnB
MKEKHPLIGAEMNTRRPRSGATVVPTVRYRDVDAAVVWLNDAFGFEPHRLLTAEDGSVRYAELTFGTGMVMVGPVEEDGLGKLMVQPGDIGGAETQICYLFVEDAQRQYERVRAAGADIVLDMTEEANEGRGFSCRDPEGHVWVFGSYDPWMRMPPAAGRNMGGHRRRAARAFALIGLLVAGAYLYEPAREALGEFRESAAAADLASDDGQTELTNGNPRAEGKAKTQLANERLASAATEQTLKELRDRLALEVGLREAAQKTAGQARDQLAGLLAKHERTGQAEAEARAQLQRARAAKEAAEQSEKEAREQLAQSHSARAAAERVLRARTLALREQRARLVAAREAARAKAALASFPPRALP